jgi:hypothetical protein
MSKPITPTHELAHAAGRDAGNRSMRAAGRTRWNDDDWNAAAATYERVAGPANSTTNSTAAYVLHRPVRFGNEHVTDTPAGMRAYAAEWADEVGAPVSYVRKDGRGGLQWARPAR